MKINERFEAIDLIDYYGCLLTDHQLNVLKDYYENDLSMIEIAENYGISKSAVSDLLKRSLNQLEMYENKLHLSTNALSRAIILNELLAFKDSKVQELAKALQALEE